MNPDPAAVEEKLDPIQFIKEKFPERKLSAAGEQALWAYIKLNEAYLTSLYKTSSTYVTFAAYRMIEILYKNSPELEHLFPSLAQCIIGNKYLPYLDVIRSSTPDAMKDLYLLWVMTTMSHNDYSIDQSLGVQYVKSYLPLFEGLEGSRGDKSVFTLRMAKKRDFDNILGIRIPLPAAEHDRSFMKTMFPVKCSMYCGAYVKNFCIMEMGSSFTSLHPAGSLLATGSFYYGEDSVRLEFTLGPSYQPSAERPVQFLQIELLGQVILSDEARLSFLKELEKNRPDPEALGFHWTCFE
jgi:hypothetical protein